MQRDSLAHASNRGKVLAAGAAYVLVHLAVVGVLPPPASATLRAALGSILLFVPPALAALAAAQAARQTRGSERAFWLLLSAAPAGHAVAEILFAAHHSTSPGPAAGAMPAAAHLCHYTGVVLLMVALLVRPDLPRGPRELRSAVLDWVMAAVGGYFLLIYFALLPRADAHHPWLLVATLQQVLPGLWALVLAWRVKEPPFRDVYRLLAFGLCAGALFSLRPDWLCAQGRYEVYNPWDVAWTLPFFPMAAAALGPRGAVWVRAPGSAAAGRGRGRLAVLALAGPPLIDLACRAAGLQPALAAQRTELTLACSAMLSLLLALRVRPPRPRAEVEAADAGEARAPRGEPSAYLQFVSGVAHELNNPLMAVAGWAELTLGRGTAEPAVRALLDATSTAAGVVARLQQLVRSGSPEAP